MENRGRVGGGVAGPLAGIRVLDVSRVLAGPFASMILADLGAEVIKVEMPGTGDESRGFGPFLHHPRRFTGSSPHPGESAYFISVNRGKKGLTVDLSHPRGAALVRRLAGRCDVLIENFRPGTMARFGLDAETLRADNPGLIYASVSGFGQTGPYARRPAYDVIIQGMSGVASITGNLGGPPVKVGNSIADLSASLFAVIGILTALYARGRGGGGQAVDVAMLDCQVALLENAVARYVVEGVPPGPLGSRHPTITPFQFFEASDGHLVVGAGNNGLWARLCRALGLDALIEDPRFITNASRTEHCEALAALLNERLRERTVAEWLEVLEAAGVPCGPIHRIDQVVNDPHVNAREMIVEVGHRGGEGLKVPGSPLKFSREAVDATQPAPRLGEHTEEILKGLLGMTDEEIAELRAERVV
ncbi:MAG: carnitine dehydratase [Candidatus Handelsmanbacteria bacterium RIFCSPLOWO2_12_FULL_64_10]|uniref:Carnitine dehydratase n=1 Tax=Handelsmanbacteria sp. (strain RIFCSPLOWO2_12_FULL_64_10) TaxID=1817868 RepID=A0A1F6CQG0_HANXR|nr:MAG: carnitine dehydratase [Candidatus Handelsmanbacteria bacterium RIFCSPLOWO2_12_FULL_64_10]